MINFFENLLLRDKIQTPQNNFNIVRLALALMVVFFHAYPVGLKTNPLLNIGGSSVNLGEFAVGVFFFLSGLFVTQSWLKNPHIIPFFCRRIARIIPGLFICVLSTTLVAVCFFSQQGLGGLRQSDTWIYIFNNSFIFFLQGSVFQSSLRIPGVFNYLSESAINGPLWTLFWEGRFYIALGLLGVSAVTPSKYWFTFIGSLTLLYIGFDADLTFLKIKYFLWEYKLLALFVSGMIVCTLSSFITIRNATVLGLFIYFFLNHLGSGNVGIFLIGCVVVLWFGTLSIEPLRYLRTHDYSYSVYIYHFPIIQMLKKYYPENGWDFTLFFYTLIILLPICILSWKFVEKPAIDLANQILRKYADT